MSETSGNTELIKNERVVLHPNKTKWLLVLLGLAAFLLGFVSMIQDGGPARSAPFGDARFWGWVGVVICGICLPTSLLQLFRGRLVLAPDGFTMWTLAGQRNIRWSDVASFEAVEFHPLVWLVHFDYVPDYSRQRQRRALSWSIITNENALPDTYGMKADDLAALMNRWRKRHADRATA
jgi:hypothetical protein